MSWGRPLCRCEPVAKLGFSSFQRRRLASFPLLQRSSGRRSGVALCIDEGDVAHAPVLHPAGPRVPYPTHGRGERLRRPRRALERRARGRPPSEHRALRGRHRAAPRLAPLRRPGLLRGDLVARGRGRLPAGGTRCASSGAVGRGSGKHRGDCDTTRSDPGSMGQRSEPRCCQWHQLGLRHKRNRSPGAAWRGSSHRVLAELRALRPATSVVHLGELRRQRLPQLARRLPPEGLPALLEFPPRRQLRRARVLRPCRLIGGAGCRRRRRGRRCSQRRGRACRHLFRARCSGRHG
mmetsp:Transcript_85810/g.246278  ORF Transcript_85810/g.246278 Transcript_85810/m.246278 type:complete len:293 (+) Transcript_85810:351-1229(+)